MSNAESLVAGSLRTVDSRAYTVHDSSDMGFLWGRIADSSALCLVPMDHRPVLRASSHRRQRPADVHEGVSQPECRCSSSRLPFAVWHFWIKPWRRERKITLDGMLMLALGLMVFQDPLLNYFNTWCTYNTWLFNMGAWTSHVPGWSAPEEPGRMVSEPLINNFIGYGYGVLLTHHAWLLDHAEGKKAVARYQ